MWHALTLSAPFLPQVVLLLRRSGVLSKVGEGNLWDNMADAVENARLSLV